MVYVYLIKSGHIVIKNIIITGMVYLFLIIVFTAICLALKFILVDDSIESGINNISLADNSFLPSYLGYFFVALSIPNKEWQIFLMIYILVFVFTFCSSALYFNPLFLVFGYSFYYITTANEKKVFLISKRKIDINSLNVEFKHLKRIKGFTFIDTEK
jgi:hypothetical protein